MDTLNAARVRRSEHVHQPVHEGSSLETSTQGFLLGAGHIRTLCLAGSKTPDSQKECWWCLYKGLGQSEPPLSVEEWWGPPPDSQGPREQAAEDQPCKRSCLRRAGSELLRDLVCTRVGQRVVEMISSLAEGPLCALMGKTPGAMASLPELLVLKH